MSVDRTALVASVGRLETSVRDHARTDRVFVIWWALTFVLSWMTFGGALIYYAIARVTRINAHIERKRVYHDALIEFTRLYAEDNGQAEACAPQIEALRASLGSALGSSLKPISAGRAALMTLLTLGLWGIVVFRWINRAWDDLQRFEAAQIELLNSTWIELGLLTSPVEFKIDEGKRRRFAPNAALSVLTLGLWFLTWDYRVYNDPNKLYPVFNKAEAAFLRAARQKAGLAWSTRPYFEPDVSWVAQKVKSPA